MAARTPLTFTDADRADRAHDRYHHPCPRVQPRMEVVRLVSQGETQRRAAAPDAATGPGSGRRPPGP